MYSGLTGDVGRRRASLPPGRITLIARESVAVPIEKNEIHWPSGDHAGSKRSSAGRAASEMSGARFEPSASTTSMTLAPDATVSVKASRRLSGDQANGPQYAICAPSAVLAAPETTTGREPSAFAT